MESEFAIVGGGILGISIAWGLQRMGRDVMVIDEGDFAFRASRGNFGLVWVQGKGDGLPDYARWTLRSASLWPDFADELEDTTGIKLELSQ
ncbi:MAG: FAD-dependent oxidoreductase, partial [Arenicellales bacterium]